MQSYSLPLPLFVRAHKRCPDLRLVKQCSVAVDLPSIQTTYITIYDLLRLYNYGRVTVRQKTTMKTCEGRAGHLGQGWAGQGRAGQGRAGQGRAGQGRAGQGRAGQGRAGQGRAGQGRAGQGRAGQGKMSS